MNNIPKEIKTPFFTATPFAFEVNNKRKEFSTCEKVSITCASIFVGLLTLGFGGVLVFFGISKALRDRKIKQLDKPAPSIERIIKQMDKPEPSIDQLRHQLKEYMDNHPLPKLDNYPLPKKKPAIVEPVLSYAQEVQKFKDMRKAHQEQYEKSLKYEAEIRQKYHLPPRENGAVSNPKLEIDIPK